jgi:putative ABC transport system ATP-binding protein
MSPVLEIQHAIKEYPGGVRALDDVCLVIDRGELLAIVGPSGSGKSTLLNLIGGLDRATRGTVRVADHDLHACSEGELARFRRRGVGFVFQFFQLVPELTAWENVLLPARLARDLKAGRRRANELVERLGVTDAVSRLPGELSGGEQQRVAIARALIMRPRVLLADEPTGNLDAAAGEDVLELLRDAVSETRAVIMVTHHAEHASSADRILQMREGRLEA